VPFKNWDYVSGPGAVELILSQFGGLKWLTLAKVFKVDIPFVQKYLFV
jgi:hypothetical protein